MVLLRWNNILFTGESRFYFLDPINVFQSTDAQGSDLRSANIRTTRKFVGDSIMIWKVICVVGHQVFSRGSLTADQYIPDVLARKCTVSSNYWREFGSYARQLSPTRQNFKYLNKI